MNSISLQGPKSLQDSRVLQLALAIFILFCFGVAGEFDYQDTVQMDKQTVSINFEN